MAYNSEYQKAWYQKNKEAQKAKASANNELYRLRNRQYVDEIKSKPCTDCGEEYPPCVMQFDHIGTDKEFNIAKGVLTPYSIERLQAEIDKCELVCANCHAIRTYNRRNGIVAQACGAGCNPVA